MEIAQTGSDPRVRPIKRARISGWSQQDESTISETKDDLATGSPHIPSFSVHSDDFSPETFFKAYEKFQAVHIPQILGQETAERNGLTWKDILTTFEQLSQPDKDSWCIETVGHNEKEKLSPGEFLFPDIIKERAYCSFLVQKDKKCYKKLLERLPLLHLGFDGKWRYEPCLWIFFGRNSLDDDNKSSLEGRGLHTDSVTHDGTWHFQLSGVKEWFLSPSSKLLEHWKSAMPQEESAKWDESTRVYVPCNKGDVIIVNTRLWFHRTVLPQQEYPSVSYARDFRLDGANGGAAPTGVNRPSPDGEGAAMTNLDGLYARNDIEGGTIIFTETDMPDCELHRSKQDPNCEVVELEDGRSAVVSRRDIKCGEFFCVAESSDEDEEDENSFSEEECGYIDSETEV